MSIAVLYVLLKYAYDLNLILIIATYRCTLQSECEIENHNCQYKTCFLPFFIKVCIAHVLLFFVFFNSQDIN